MYAGSKSKNAVIKESAEVQSPQPTYQNTTTKTSSNFWGSLYSYISYFNQPGKVSPTTPVNPKPVDTEPVAPIDTKPVDTEPVAPIDTKPVDSVTDTPVDTKPAQPPIPVCPPPEDTSPAVNEPIPAAPSFLREPRRL
jgi:hypothetical protein